MVGQVYHSLLDNFELLVGKRDKAAPPQRLIRQSGGDFGVVGEECLRRLLLSGELRPDACVLEVGCGCGRLAGLFTRCLSDQGGYWGFDVTAEGINWCQKNIGARHHNFHFRRADVYHELYQPQGRFKPAAYRFPYLDDYFDLVLLASAFTRMRADEMQNFLGQVRRVLKPGGKCVLGYFLLNDESKDLLGAGLGNVKLPYAGRDCMMSRPDHPAATVGFDESYIRRCCATRGLEVLDPIHYGGWCGRGEPLGQPDVLMAVKPPTRATRWIA